MKTTPTRGSALKRAFTLIELLVVIAIIGILASAAMPAMNNALESAKIRKDSSNIRQILIACRAFATDWDGLFPSFDPDDDEASGGDEGFSTSTEAFNVLIPEFVDTEAIFWFQTQDPDRLRPPREDGELEAGESVYGYAMGQTDTSFSQSPLVFNGLMDGPGEMGEWHPWLDSKKAVIGFVGGHVDTLRLTEAAPGATVQSDDRQTENIFEKRERGDDGKSSGGWLDTDPDNVLLPE